MSSQIIAIEDKLIETIKETFDKRLRTVEWAAPGWDEDFIKRMLPALPGVFVIFHGCTNPNAGGASLIVQSQWSIVAATHHVQTAKERARGDAREIGCYEICETLAPLLDGLVIDDIGAMSLVDWDTSSSLKLDAQALMVQELSFVMPIEFSRELDPSVLSPFKIFNATYNVGQLPGAPSTEDHLEVPQ